MGFAQKCFENKCLSCTRLFYFYDEKKFTMTKHTYYNATIVTLNEAMQVIEKGYLTVEGDTITAIGEGEVHADGEMIDCKGGILMPGFVNAHTHMPMTLYRGIADDLPLMEWLNEHIWPAEAKYTTEANVRIGARLGLAEMIKTGTTTFCDMYFFADAVAEETAKAGVRAVMGEGVMEFSNNSFSGSSAALAKAEAFIQKWQGHALIQPGAIFHATYTCKRETLEQVKAMADKYQVPLTTHISETEEEVENVTKDSGKNPAQYLKELGLLNAAMTGAHCVWLTEEDQQDFLQNGSSVAHCPSSNLKLGSGIAPIPAYLEKGINVALGTDGTASNNNLDMVEEMRLAALVHKGNTKNPTVVNDKQALRMATINGAKALGLDKITGSLEVGKKADFQLVEVENTFMTPIYDVYSALVYSMNSHNIDTVVVNGQVLMRNRELLTLDESVVLKEMNEAMGSHPHIRA